ncbi:hypothetical protein ACHAXT_006517 [Thalassiosira profunda]
MRRSGSASCLLRPRNSLSAQDLRRLASGEGVPTATVLTVDRLPSYCPDRLYLQSELAVHAHAVRFLCDLEGSDSRASDGGEGPAFPPSIILYLLWKPNTYPTPRAFADGPLSDAVRKCLLANGDEVPETELENVRSRPRPPHYAPRRQSLDLIEKSKSEDEVDSRDATNESRRESRGRESETQQLTRIYVVVDRVSPSEADETLPNFQDLASPTSSYEEFAAGSFRPMGNALQSQTEAMDDREQQRIHRHNAEIRTAEQLARAVASSRFLRNRIDGISIGITSDARAAPGLEACTDAVARKAKERRLAARDRSVRNLRRKRGETRETNEWDGGFDAGNDDNMRQFRRKEKMLERMRDGSPERSPVAFVAVRPDDLEGDGGHDHHHDHNHVPPTLRQCRVSSEWNGKGEHKTFADRAMGDWRKAWRVAAADGEGAGTNGSGGGACRPKVPRIRRDVTSDEERIDVDEPVSTAMVAVFLAALAAYVWNAYGDVIRAFLFGEVLEK